jgi:hypothetical protein
MQQKLLASTGAESARPDAHFNSSNAQAVLSEVGSTSRCDVQTIATSHRQLQAPATAERSTSKPPSLTVGVIATAHLGLS